MTKSKTFTDKEEIKSNSSKLTGTDNEPVVVLEENDDDSELIPLDKIPSAHEEEEEEEEETRPRKRSRDGRFRQLAEEQEDDKKKLGFNTSYEGFSIWGWVLCLLVDRKGGPGKKVSKTDGQALMAEWITSTQLQREDDG